MPTRTKRADNTSGYVGVAWCKRANKWEAYIYAWGAKRHLGLFTNPAEAAKVRDRAAREYHLDPVVLNFP